MKKALILLVVLFSCTLAKSLQPDSSLTNNHLRLNVEGLTFSFKNQQDSLTLKPFSYGVLSIDWDQVEGEGNILAFKYRLKGEDWQYSYAETGDQHTAISELEENQIFEYQLGIGNSESEIQYSEVTEHFNTISSFVFENNSAKGKEESASLYWAIPHNKLEDILSVYPDATFSLKYNTKIGESQNKSDKTKSPWVQINHIPINTVKYQLDDLIGGEKYVYKIGLDTGNEIVWSEKQKFSVERGWGIFKLLILIGALGLFIFGMKIMSEGLQKAAGSRLRNMLASITSNRFKGVLTGLGITSVVQSSSVTTVMTVSFVNAGLMNLKQAAGVIMGANIGTTMTAWLILLFGFKVDIAGYALVLIAFGAPLLFFAKSSVRNWASVIIGFSLLFMGLGFLKSSVPEIGADSPLVQFFVDYRDAGLIGTLMFIGFGTLATVIIQSSSATMALTMTMVAGGVLPFEVAAAMILGENIGTTITAQLAALIGNVHAKRAARIHALFNLIGVFWCVLIFHLFLKGVAYFIKGDPFTNPEDANEGLALFHSAFNIANVLILVWFVPKLVTLAEKSVRSRGASDEEFHLDYIGTGMMGTPDLSILEAKKEVAKFGEITSRMSTFTQQLLKEQNKKNKSKLHEKIAKYEEITDRVEIEVANYLAKVSSGDMTETTAKHIRQMNSIVNDLERIGDIFFQISKAIERKDLERVYFLPEQRTSLLDMFKLVDEAFEVMIKNLKADWEYVTYQEALEIEERINEKRDEMRTEHLVSMNQEGFNINSGMVYNNLFSSCEKIGDHIINVTEAIAGNIE